MTNQVIYLNEEQTKAFVEETDFSASYSNNAHVISTYLTKQIDTFVPGRHSVVIISPNKNAIVANAIGITYSTNTMNPFLCYKQGTSRQLASKKEVRKHAERIIEYYLVGSLYTTIIVLHNEEKQTKLVDELIYELRSDNGTMSEVVSCFTPIAHVVKSLFNFIDVKLPVIKFNLNSDCTIHVKKVGSSNVHMSLYEFNRSESAFPRLLDSKPLKGAMIFSGLFVETPVENLLKLVNTVAKGKHKKDAMEYVNGYLTKLGHSDLTVSKWYKAINTPKAKLVFVPLEKLHLGVGVNKAVYMSKERNGMVVVVDVDHPLVTEALNDRKKSVEYVQQVLGVSSAQEEYENAMLDFATAGSTKSDTDGDSPVEMTKTFKELFITEGVKGDTDGDVPAEPMDTRNPTVPTGEANTSVNIVDNGEGISADKLNFIAEHAKGLTEPKTTKAERKRRSKKDGVTVGKDRAINDKPAPTAVPSYEPESTEQSSEKSTSSEE